MRRPETPVTLNLKEMEGSMYNTPPCWSIYVCGLVFKHLLAAGGLPGVKANNDAKAKLVYDAIAASNGFYSSPVEPSMRSNMNIPFTIPSSPDLEKAFVSEASNQNMVRLSSSLPLRVLQHPSACGVGVSGAALGLIGLDCDET